MLLAAPCRNAAGMLCLHTRDQPGAEHVTVQGNSDSFLHFQKDHIRDGIKFSYGLNSSYLGYYGFQNQKGL